MKFALRTLTITLATAMAVAVLSFPTLAETRGRALKRAEKEIRATNFAEAEKIYRQLLEKDQADKDARLVTAKIGRVEHADPSHVFDIRGRCVRRRGAIHIRVVASRNRTER